MKCWQLIFLIPFTFGSGCKKEVVAPSLISPEITQVKQTVQIIGRVSSSSRKTVTSPFVGKVLEIRVKLGDQVKRDQVLAVLEATELIEKIKAQRTSVTRTLSQMDTTRIQIQKLERDRVRLKQAYQLRTISAASLEESETKLALLKSQREAERRALIAEQDVVRQIERQLSESQIRAPIDGRIIDLWMNPSDFVRGMPIQSGDPMFTIASRGMMRIKSLAPEFQTAQLEEGQSVSIKLVSNPERHWMGRVLSIRPPSSKDEESAGNFEVLAEFDPANDMVRNGLEAVIEATTGFRDRVLAVPKTAIQTLGGKSFVLKWTINGLTKAQLATGLIGDTNIEIVRGLTRGERIAEIYEEPRRD